MPKFNSITGCSDVILNTIYEEPDAPGQPRKHKIYTFTQALFDKVSFISRPGTKKHLLKTIKTEGSLRLSGFV